MAEGWGGGDIDDRYATAMTACHCIGPQHGQPRCPCLMRGLIQRNGRWIEPERPWNPTGPGVGGVGGCVCPPTSEQTCQAPICPRKPPNFIVTSGVKPDPNGSGGGI